MTTRPTHSQTRETERSAPTETAARPKESGRHPLKDLSPIVHQVIEGFMESLQSTGEGVLPIVLLLQPELSTHGIAESDAEFARRGRRQSAAERRFFRTIEAALRDAVETILDRATRAAMKRRTSKDGNFMAAGGRPHLNGTPTPRASLR